MPPRKPTYIKPGKPKVLLFGAPDCDKSKLMCEWPNSVFIDTEDGAVESQYVKTLTDKNSLYMGVKDGSLNMKEVIDQVKKLIVTPGDRQAIIIDSVTQMQDSKDVEEQEKMGDKKDPFASYKKAGVQQLRRLVALTKQLDMAVWLVAHAKDNWEGEGENRKVVGKTFNAWAPLGHAMNLQCHAIRVGGVTYMKVIRSKYAALIRGQEIPMTYDAFSKAFGKEVIERKPEGLVIATPEQVAEILKLTGILRIEEEELTASLNKAGAEEVQDLSKENAAKFIEELELKRKGDK